MNKYFTSGESVRLVSMLLHVWRIRSQSIWIQYKISMNSVCMKYVNEEDIGEAVDTFLVSDIDYNKFGILLTLILPYLFELFQTY